MTKSEGYCPDCGNTTTYQYTWYMCDQYPYCRWMSKTPPSKEKK